MDNDSKVLTGLMERRALIAAFTRLTTLTDPDEIAAQVDEIAGHGPAALATLVMLLDTEDPLFRGRLGLVVRRLDRDASVAALREAALGRGKTDQARVTALTLLERFLDVPVDEGLLSGLQDPDGVAQQSLRELIGAMEHEPEAILEYLTQLAQQPPDSVQMILEAIPSMPPSPHLSDLLRMLAQDENRAWAQEALTQLGRTRTPEARAALKALAATLPLELAAAADRGARKLMMSGVRETPVDMKADTWRALLSSVDGMGAQLIWFIHQAAGQDTGAVLAVLCRDAEGIIESSLAPAVPAAALPPPQPPGEVHTYPLAAGWPPVTFLEVPWAVGRSAVQRALAQHWAAGTTPPLEYRWLNPLIWLPPAPEEDVAVPPPEERTPDELAALLDHPAFSGWLWYHDAVRVAARRLGPQPSAADRSAQVTRLAAAYFGAAVVASYQRRLDAMAQWLTLAGEAEAAALAATAAARLADDPPAETPLIRRLIDAGLDAALIELRLRASARRKEGRAGPVQ